ncbi:hypothetical protein B0H16DRAFT_1783285 [Mycena metata]|uniref:Uncharacterized protein n=1 Tax=Mycena metata TaxID=1033252 RepID=A0AAD7KEX9_9AGAR|nr:hypothetical protein B0H16DRAFT_1783285 [Mycena metata]
MTPVHSDSSVRPALEDARNLVMSVHSRTHSKLLPGISFTGFDSFEEVRRGFEFHNNRPAFYPPPVAELHPPNGHLLPPHQFRPSSVLSVNSSIHSPMKEDDTMISMLGGGHVRRRSVGSMFDASLCVRVEKRKYVAYQEAHFVTKTSIASTSSSKFGDEIKARQGLLVLFASGSPFREISYGGRLLHPGQGNNMGFASALSSGARPVPAGRTNPVPVSRALLPYIFLELSLSAILACCSSVSDSMVEAALLGLANSLTPNEEAAGLLLRDRRVICRCKSSAPRNNRYIRPP